MTTQNLELSEHDSEFVRRCVLEGRYKNANEVVEAGLRLLEEREEEELLQLERLRVEVKKGMDDLEAGRYVEVNSPEELRALFDKIKQEAASRLESRQNRVLHDSMVMERHIPPEHRAGPEAFGRDEEE